MLFALQPVPLVAPEKFEARTAVETTVDAISAIAATISPDLTGRLICHVYMDPILTKLMHQKFPHFTCMLYQKPTEKGAIEARNPNS